MKPFIVVNFKTYKQGRAALKLAKQIQKADKNILVAVQPSDLYEISRATSLKVYVQHVDFQKPGRATGFILPEAVKEDRAKGTLLNHSEHPLKFRILKKTLKRCKQTGLKAIICVSALKQAKKVLKFNPLGVAFEVPELIGTGRAISKFQPDSVKNFAKIVKLYNKKHKAKIKALCGAGISTPEDVHSALNLGCHGVLIASAVTKSKTPGKLLRKMLEA